MVNELIASFARLGVKSNQLNHAILLGSFQRVRKVEGAGSRSLTELERVAKLVF